MSELKVFATTIYNPTTTQGVVYNVYNKDEADRYIAHQKYKRCLAMALSCHIMWIDKEFWEKSNNNYKCYHYWRWWNIWNELAEKFKEARKA